jgi:hypothetical protein
MTHRVFLEFLNVHTALPPSIYFSSQTYHVRSPEHFKANGIASYTIFYENGLTGSARLPNFHSITCAGNPFRPSITALCFPCGEAQNGHGLLAAYESRRHLGDAPPGSASNKNGFFLLYNIVNEKGEGISPSPASLIAD